MSRRERQGEGKTRGGKREEENGRHAEGGKGVRLRRERRTRRGRRW